jgi:hypothetical protein
MGLLLFEVVIQTPSLMGFLDYRYLRGLNGISPTNLLGSIGV